MPGHLIVFEGVEGGGKSTQLQRAHDWLQASDLWPQRQGADIVITREPGGTALGRSIRQLLLYPPTTASEIGEAMGDRTELLLYAADRAQHVDGLLKPALDRGALVLCDRFTDSTVAYQGYGRGLDLVLIHQLNQIATGGLRSDLTLWLDVDPAVGLARTRQRGAADRMEQNSLDFHRRVQRGFQALALAAPERMVRIDANGAEEVVFQQIQGILTIHLQRWYGCQ